MKQLPIHMAPHRRLVKSRPIRRRGRRTFVTLGLAAATVMTLAGCGSASSAGSGSSGSAKGGPLALAVPVVSANTDPQQHDGPGNAYWVFQTAGTLVTPGRAAAGSTTLPSAQDIKPGLATSWKVEPTGIVFKLRDAKSQYGNRLTAEDVKWSFDRILPIKDPVSPSFAASAGINLKNPVTIINSDTIKVNGTPNPITLDVLYYKGFNIYDYTAVKKHTTASDPYAKTWLANHTATFGAYETTALDPSEQLTLAANPYYYGPKPKFSPITIRSVPTSSTELQLLEANSVDMVTGLNVDDFVSVKKRQSAQTPALASVDSAELGFTVDRAPLNNLDLREAISLAINRQQIVNGPFAGLARVPRGYVSASVQQSGAPTPFQENLAEAKALVKKSGFHGPITLGYASIGLTGIGVDVSSIAILLQSQLRRAGIDVKLVEVPDAEYFADVIAHHFDMFFDLIGGQIPDAAYELNLSFGKTGFLNFDAYDDPKVDAILQKALAAKPPMRNELAAKAETLIRADMPATILAEPLHYFAIRKGITGMTPTGGDLVYLQDLTPGS